MRTLAPHRTNRGPAPFKRHLRRVISATFRRSATSGVVKSELFNVLLLAAATVSPWLSEQGCVATKLAVQIGGTWLENWPVLFRQFG